MKSNHSFHQECYAPDLTTEPEATIFTALKSECSPKKRFTQGDLWRIQRASRKLSVRNEIRYCF
jgi:hypothetical protein